MSKKAVITGITGQDGAYLAKLLLDKGYTVYGAMRRSSSNNFWRLNELEVTKKINFVQMELLEFSNIQYVLEDIQPDEVYNLAAQSFVGTSFDQPIYTMEANGVGVLKILEVIRRAKLKTKLYQASTSEMFGKVAAPIQDENTPFYPRSPYAVSKLCAHWAVVNYRESYGMHASSGILFNHESPFRGTEFVTRKITSSLARIAAGQQEMIELGNLDSKRDWGHAQDYVHGMWLMLQQAEPNDYVLATGETHSVREFCEKAARFIGMDVVWEGEGEKSVGKDRKTNKTIIRVNPAYYRPAEVDYLLGNANKAKSKLGWERKHSFDQLVEVMMKADMDRMQRGECLL